MRIWLHRELGLCFNVRVFAEFRFSGIVWPWRKCSGKLRGMCKVRVKVWCRLYLG